ncbi:DUF2169 domain-containing protein [Agrobacterium sp. fls2-241-TYG-188a]|uniref:DUF2169 domain-containing protein n=1 Tax=Agrobacterium sp. fls2-241-TYG-188a TaxID=3040275 RepID=UPI00254F8A42|nr:DUF2169 domain-containing protein [Agrobacterium sp. fls2-241-TYG-188a]
MQYGRRSVGRGSGTRPGHTRLEGQLPKLKLSIELDQGKGPARAAMVLDGVHFDMRPDVGRVFLTWRVGFPWASRKGLPKLIFLSSQREVA